MGGHVHVPHFIQLFYIFIGSLKQGTNRILKTHQKYISNTHPTLFNNQGHVRIITYSNTVFYRNNWAFSHTKMAIASKLILKVFFLNHLMFQVLRLTIWPEYVNLSFWQFVSLYATFSCIYLICTWDVTFRLALVFINYQFH